ncbi:MAG: TrkH family potassium uptake protein [Clostridia bacterium]|nr:TrkH family potassium uptake protein [Clostridia bacterium]
MNRKAILYILGWVLNIDGAFMILPFLVSLLYQEEQGWSFLIVAAICIAAGTLLVLKKPKNMVIYEKEGFVIVAFSWILFSLFGCLPFVINGDIPDFTNALFETVSGFTTTGASILTNIEVLSHASLFWRSFSNWIGGMGVLVFLLAVMPMKGGGSQIHIMRAESPGPIVDRLVPKIKNTASILYIMYIVLTVIEFIMLVAGGMSAFEAICASFSTAGTGGFAIKNDSFMSYSPYIQWVVAVFMMLFGINFGAYFLLTIRRFKEAFRYEEARGYIFIILAATAIIAWRLIPQGMGIEETLRHSFFQVSSIITTTGFVTANFDLWPQAAKVILVLLMFIGACAGSTGGGIKVSRVMILAKTVKKEIMIYIHPNSVKKIKMEGKQVSHETLRATNVFFITYILIFVASVFLLSFEDHSLETSFTAVVATFNNIGPGLAEVGPVGNFSGFTNFSKYVMIFDMLAGRLELYPILMIFHMGMWKSAIVPPIKRRMVLRRK